MREYIIIVAFTGLISYVLVPVTIKIAHHVNAISIPHSRHIHTKAMPLLGGIAIFLSFLFGFMIFGTPEHFSQRTLTYEVPAILISSIITLLLGIIDDIKPIRARTKFSVQLLIAFIVVFYGKMRIDGIFDFLPLYVDMVISILLTIFWIVSVINAINLVDGLNGLSAGVSAIYFGTVIVLFFMGGSVTKFSLLIASLMLGATLGYLPWNFPKAKVFMGDAGSMFLGLMIAVLPLLGFKQVTLVSLFLPMMMMIAPVFEIFSTVLRRSLNNISLGEADDNHIHHQLLRATKSPVKAVLIIWFVSALYSIDSIILEIGNEKVGMVIFIILTIIGLTFLQLSRELNNVDSTARKIIRWVKEK